MCTGCDKSVWWIRRSTQASSEPVGHILPCRNPKYLGKTFACDRVVIKIKVVINWGVVCFNIISNHWRHQMIDHLFVFHNKEIFHIALKQYITNCHSLWSIKTSQYFPFVFIVWPSPGEVYMLHTPDLTSSCTTGCTLYLTACTLPWQVFTHLAFPNVSFVVTNINSRFLKMFIRVDKWF